MSIRAIEHVQLAMPEGGEDAARAFYGGVLGLGEVPKPLSLRSRGGLWFAHGGVRLHLGIDPEFRPATRAHPAFVVDDLDWMVKTIEAAGHAIAAAVPLEGWHRVYVHDPFGNRIELMQPA
jgi:catechol 2,3-dioxygenase-like lactoylglutathione lyase family enzyme